MPEVASRRRLALAVIVASGGGKVGISIADRNHKPTAMDVIEGKTTMEYKIIDGVKVDSALIFKPEFKK